MPVCGKPVTRPTRSGGEMTPTLAYPCDIPIPDGESGHLGPCASTSDLGSVERRKHWEGQHAQDERIQRHRASGLSQTQSIPMSSASIMETGETEPQRKVGRPHPSQEVDCPFCEEKPLAKDLYRHVAAHKMHETPDGAAQAEVRSNLIASIPQPPESLMHPQRQVEEEHHQVYFVDPGPAESVQVDPSEYAASYDSELPIWLAEAIVAHHISELPEGNFLVLRRAWAVVADHLPG